MIYELCTQITSGPKETGERAREGFEMAIERWRLFVSVERWDPFRNMTDIQGEVNRLFDAFLGRPTASTTGLADRTWAPVLDMHETKDDLVLNFDLPGVTEKDVSLSIMGALLTGKGEPAFSPHSKA